MLEAVERRFGAYRAPSVIEMLSDNGSPYIAEDKQIFARQLGLKPCFTPVRSPQSNGISFRDSLENVVLARSPFVKTLKRDYVQATPLPDTRAVLGWIGVWMGDYNDDHPHSGLKMRSPLGVRPAHLDQWRSGPHSTSTFRRCGWERKALPIRRHRPHEQVAVTQLVNKAVGKCDSCL